MFAIASRPPTPLPGLGEAASVTDTDPCQAVADTEPVIGPRAGRAVVECGTGTAKTFAGDLGRLIEAVRNRRPFAFSRFGDGEWMIIRNLGLDFTQKGNGEFRFDPACPRDSAARAALIESFHDSAPGYLVGIGCPCCWGRELLAPLRQVCHQPESRLTWANLWGNANYPRVRNELVPLFGQDREVYLVCHRTADPSSLPFRVQEVFPVGTNAWTEDFALVSRIVERAMTCREALFLFCAGPFSNILAQRGFAANPENTYLDLGSVLDPWLFARHRWRWLDRFPALIRCPGITRGYLKSGRKRKQVCQWWTPTSDELQNFPARLPADVDVSTPQDHAPACPP